VQQLLDELLDSLDAEAYVTAGGSTRFLTPDSSQ